MAFSKVTATALVVASGSYVLKQFTTKHSLIKEIKKQKKELAQSASKTKDLEKKNNDLQQKNDDLKKKNDDLEQKNDDLKKAEFISSARLREQTSATNALLKENKRLRAKLS